MISLRIPSCWERRAIAALGMVLVSAPTFRGQDVQLPQVPLPVARPTAADASTDALLDASLEVEGEMPLDTGDLSLDPIVDSPDELTGEGADAVTQMTETEMRALPHTFVPRVGIGFIYDDNLFYQPHNTESDLILELIAGFMWTPRMTDKSRFSFGYQATQLLYLDHSDVNALNHLAALTGEWTLGKTTLKGTAGYQHLKSANRDVNAIAEGDTFNGTVSASYPVGGKTALIAEGRYLGTLYKDLQSTQDVSGRLGLSYSATGKTILGFSGVVGLLESDQEGSQTYEQGLLTAAYNATGKLDFHGEVGLDLRSSEGSTTTAEGTNVVFGFGAKYKMRERTTLSLDASRATFGSATISYPFVERTAFTLGVTQKIGDKFELALGGGYDLSTYQPGLATLPVRDENYLFGRAAITFQPTTTTSLSLYYQHGSTDSTIESNSYKTNRVGIQFLKTF